MKSWRIFMFLCLVSIALGCGQTAVQNDAATPAAGYSQNGAPTQTPVDNRNQTSASTPAVDEKDEGLNADFEGTSGIVDKKYDVKGAALLTAVRVARQQNFDRIVFEFEGAELPGYHIEYIDKPVRACGSGNVVSLKGDGWLQIRFYPANAHTEAGQPTVKVREMSPDLPIIKELKSTCDFEAEVEWVAGVASPNRYRVLELKNPTRLAVDIKHK